MKFLFGVLVGYNMRGKRKLLITVLASVLLIDYVILPAGALPSSQRTQVCFPSSESQMRVRRLGVASFARRGYPALHDHFRRASLARCLFVSDRRVGYALSFFSLYYSQDRFHGLSPRRKQCLSEWVSARPRRETRPLRAQDPPCCAHLN